MNLREYTEKNGITILDLFHLAYQWQMGFRCRNAEVAIKLKNYLANPKRIPSWVKLYIASKS